MDMTITSQDTGALLARVDGTDYLAVRAVYARTGDAAPAFYCLESAWPASPMARIAQLQARVAELEAQLAAPKETPVENQARMFRKQAASLDEADDPGACPECDRADFKNARALQTHRQRAHQGMVAGRPAGRRFVELPNDLGWRCAEPGCSGAFARDLHNPDVCIQHARKTNGHLAPA